MDSEHILYVAGNPSAYPLEYYDEGAEAYAGVIPQLLAEFAAQEGYTLLYYQADQGDQREKYADNPQVDLLSGYAAGAAAPENDGEVVALDRTGDGEAFCRLYLTHAAPVGLEEKLSSFFAGVSQDQVTTLLLDTATAPRTDPVLPWLAGGLGVAAAVLAVVLAALRRRWRRRLEAATASAHRDPVTGLENLAGLQQRYHQVVQDKTRVLYTLFCFSIDVEPVRRELGPEAAEGLLRACARTLSAHTRSEDLLARASDNCFALFRRTDGRADDADWLLPLLDQLRSDPDQPDRQGLEVHTGVYPLRAEDRDVRQMVFSAAQGAERARQEGRDFLVCSREVLGRFARQAQLREDVRRAFAQREFQMYLQCYVEAGTHRVLGGEALARWNHPQKGLLLPGDFLPLLEQEGAIGRLDYLCLQDACAFLENLAAEGVEDFFLSCNFSRATLSAPDFPDRCWQILDSYDFPRELLIVALTEDQPLQEVGRQNILALRELGLRVMMSDSGQGFSALSRLQEPAIAGLKLGKDLVDRLFTPGGRAVIQAMIQAGHQLGMTILATGVEGEDQAQALQAMHCDVLQGYCFSYPMPAREVRTELLARRAEEHPLAGSVTG